MDTGDILRAQLELFFYDYTDVSTFWESKHHEITFGCYKGSHLKNVYARVMVRMYDTSSERALQMYESNIRCKDQESMQSSTTPGPGLVEISLTVINNFVTSRPTNRCKGEIYMQELNFLCMIRRLNVLYNCINICCNTSYGNQVIEWTRNSIANDQRKISKAELLFLCMTLCSVVL